MSAVDAGQVRLSPTDLSNILSRFVAELDATVARRPVTPEQLADVRAARALLAARLAPEAPQ